MERMPLAITTCLGRPRRKASHGVSAQRRLEAAVQVTIFTASARTPVPNRWKTAARKRTYPGGTSALGPVPLRYGLPSTPVFARESATRSISILDRSEEHTSELQSP